MQKLLADLAKRECADTVKGVRSYLRAIFKEAHEEKIVDYNAGRKLVMPKTRKPNRPVLTIEQIQAIEAALSGADRVIFALYTPCGLRASEPFGLEAREVLDDCEIFVCQTYSRYGLGETKTEGSTKKVAVPESLHDALLHLRAASMAAGVR
jgi:integrase